MAGEDILNDPEHWADRAYRARRVANELKTEKYKKILLEIADDCDRRADRLRRAQLEMRALSERKAEAS